MTRRLLGSYLILLIVTAGLLAIIAYRTTQQTFDQYRAAHVSAHTEMLPSMLAYYYASNNSWEGIQIDVSRISLMVGTRIRVVDENGIIVAATRRSIVGQSIEQPVNAITDSTVAKTRWADQTMVVHGEDGTPIGTVYIDSIVVK
ncbi:hypothetical protein KFU94_13805 [Chloroflexi bacterium TSY]|nr:hypothetical protein [Chloroflexi bacterium TSY]